MNKDKDKNKIGESAAIFCFILLVACGISFIAGLISGESNGIEVMQKQAIQHKAARYNPDTAKFEWTQPVETNK